MGAIANRTLRSGTAVALGAVALVACSALSGLDDYEIVEQPPTGETGTGSSESTSTTTTTASGGGEGGATTSTATSTTSAGGGGAGGGGPTLDCGDGVTCPQGGENACCWNGVLGNADGVCIQGPPSPDTCNTAVAQDGLRTRIECQAPSHCDPAEICCGDRELYTASNGYYVTVTCQSQCEWPDIHMCDPMNPVCPIVIDNGQPVQTMCEPSMLLPAGFFVCGTP